MAIRVVVQRGQQSITPVRFCRAVTGDPVSDAPDVDDRGFAMGTRPTTWGRTNATGAMVGIREGDTIRIKVLREDIENAAELYVTSSNTSVVRVVSPANGGPLPNNGIFQIRGVADRKNSPVKVQVHYGAADGPVIGELEPHIFQEISIRVSFHLVSIYGSWTNRRTANINTTRTNLTNLLEQVNAIWRPCGIRFTITNTRIVEEQIRRHPTTANRTQYYNRSTSSWQSLPNPLGAAGNFARPGEISVSASWGNQHQYREFNTVLQINSIASTINIYCVQNSATLDNTGNLTGRPFNGACYVGGRLQGLVIVDGASKYDLAHEIGHFLNNNHSDEDSGGNDTADKNIWLVRRLMYSDWPAAAPDYRNDVGYGANQYGALISVKKLRGTYSNVDGELDRSRRKARNPF